MSYYYEFEEQHRILLAVVYGCIDEDELRELYFDIRRRKDEEHPLTGVMDFTGVTKLDVSSQVIRELAYHPPNFIDPTLRAIIAPTDYLFGIARMFQIIGSETRKQLHIVRTLQEAITLLDAEGAQFHRLDAA